MSDQSKLLLIKIIHTIIWLIFVIVIFYILYAGIYDKINAFTWTCIGLVLFEGLVLLTFKLSCPLTLVARKYSKSSKDNFDIFLPNWLARYNKVIFGLIFICGIIIVLIQTLRQ